MPGAEVYIITTRQEIHILMLIHINIFIVKQLHTPEKFNLLYFQQI